MNDTSTLFVIVQCVCYLLRMEGDGGYKEMFKTSSCEEISRYNHAACKGADSSFNVYTLKFIYIKL